MILKQIKQDQLQARKNSDKFKAGVLTCLIGEIEIIGKNDGNRDTTDSETLKVVTKFKKGVNDTISLVNDKISTDELMLEVSYYDEYLPTQMTEDELREYIIETIALGATNIGEVMKNMKMEINGQYDGKMASVLIKELL